MENEMEDIEPDFWFNEAQKLESELEKSREENLEIAKGLRELRAEMRKSQPTATQTVSELSNQLSNRNLKPFERMALETKWREAARNAIQNRQEESASMTKDAILDMNEQHAKHIAQKTTKKVPPVDPRRLERPDPKARYEAAIKKYGI